MSRHSTHSIPTFPADIDRPHFASWLSGLVDGEGCFGLNCLHRRRNGRWHPACKFTIALRDDDYAVLYLVQSFWGCGAVAAKAPPRGDDRNSKPQMVYRVQDITSLVRCVVPHFERYPLLAKKKRDFALWKEAVAMCHHISQRPLFVRGRKGTQITWSDEEVARFKAMMVCLREVRKYGSGDVPPPLPMVDPPRFFGHLLSDLMPPE